MAGLLVSLILAAAPPQPVRVVTGRYTLPAKGFSVLVPREAAGLLEGDPRTERGIRITLRSGSSVLVFGGPNSLEFRTPADGLRWVISTKAECSAGAVDAAQIGTLLGAATRLSCGDQVWRYALVFRPGGGLVYWLLLETTAANEVEDAKVFTRVAASFRVTRWK